MQPMTNYDEQKLRCFSMNKEGTKVVSKKNNFIFHAVLTINIYTV